MSTQQSLKNRLRSAHNILHITQAMEIVASVQFHKLMNKIDYFRFYFAKLSELIERIKPAIAVNQHPLFKIYKGQYIGVVIITGDKGLCGSYNANVIKEAELFLNSLNHDHVELFLFGKKAVDHFKNKKWKIKQNLNAFTQVVTENSANQWIQASIESFKRDEFDELWIVYTHFINTLSREPRVEKILPLSVDESNAQASPIDFIFEPNPEEIYQKLMNRFFSIQFQSFLLESYASELASRMIAMKTSAKNAEEMIEDLTLMKNKLRQLTITNEILEITAGAESLR